MKHAELWAPNKSRLTVGDLRKQIRDLDDTVDIYLETDIEQGSFVQEIDVTSADEDGTPRLTLRGFRMNEFLR